MGLLWPAVRALAAGVVTSIAAVFAVGLLVVVALLCAVGMGLLLVPGAVGMARALVGVERQRVGEVAGVELPAPYRAVDGSPVRRFRSVVEDVATWRDLAWLVLHGMTGALGGVLAVGAVLSAVVLLPAPLYWWALPDGVEISGVRVDSWPSAVVGVVAGAVYALVMLQLPRVARWQARIAVTLLRPASGVVLSGRIAELTASRAAALEAHGAELRRIERDLHDGTQARMAAVIMQLGIAEGVHEADPAAAMALVRKAQDTAEEAMAELRDVLRSVYPPVLSDRGLTGALTALTAWCPVPSTLEVDGEWRYPAAIEAAVYFVVAEALTNVTKYSGAEHVSVGLSKRGETLVITVEDDGRGGAEEEAGSGLTGIRQRAEAFEGSFAMTSPPGGPTTLRVELPCGS